LGGTNSRLYSQFFAEPAPFGHWKKCGPNNSLAPTIQSGGKLPPPFLTVFIRWIKSQAKSGNKNSSTGLWWIPFIALKAKGERKKGVRDLENLLHWHKANRPWGLSYLTIYPAYHGHMLTDIYRGECTPISTYLWRPVAFRRLMNGSLNKCLIWSFPYMTSCQRVIISATYPSVITLLIDHLYMCVYAAKGRWGHLEGIRRKLANRTLRYGKQKNQLKRGEN